MAKFNSYGHRWPGGGGRTEYIGARGLSVRGGSPRDRDMKWVNNLHMATWMRSAVKPDWVPR